MFLFDVIKVLKNEKVTFAVAGGYALALQGIVRSTVDVNLSITFNKTQFKSIEKAMTSISLKSLLPVSAEDIFNFRVEYVTQRNLIAWSFVDYSDPARVVDFLIHEPLNLKHVKQVLVSGQKVPVLSLNKLLEMKKKSGRDKDLLDIKLIKELLNEKK